MQSKIKKCAWYYFDASVSRHTPTTKVRDKLHIFKATYNFFCATELNHPTSSHHTVCIKTR